MDTKLKRLRLKQESNQGVFCRLAGLNRNQYCQIERGTYKPSAVLRDKIAKALGVAQEEIFNAEGWAILLEETPAR
jgi:DNA-binding XRE family transcriptional regulator